MSKKLIPSSLLFILTALSLIATGFAQSGDIAVVVTSQNPVSNLTTSDLRKLFQGQKRSWQNGTAVKLIVRAPNSPEKAALLHLLGMSESDYKQYWTAQVVRGEAEGEPLIIPSLGMVKEAAKVYPGAICFVAAQDLKQSMDFKILKIEGRAPGEPGYPVH